MRLSRSSSAAPEVERLGSCLRLPIHEHQFRTFFMVKAKHQAHSGALEATAVALALRRLSRSHANHNHRGSFLVDAQAVLHALQKGRTSAGTLRAAVGQVAALSLACAWRWRYAYLPSESNPADAPSRGVWREATTPGPRARSAPGPSAPSVRKFFTAARQRASSRFALGLKEGIEKPSSAGSSSLWGNASPSLDNVSLLLAR